MTRTIGVLLHPSVLPGSPVCGSFGAPSRDWVKCLACNGIGVWQFLPLSPPDPTGSPYSSPSSFALNPWFLDAQDLLEEGYLLESQVEGLPGAHQLDNSSLDFSLAEARSESIGKALVETWSSQLAERHNTFRYWCDKQFWLEDHVCFSVIRSQYSGHPWWDWPKELAFRKSGALTRWKKINRKQLLEHRLIQWHLDRQWQSLRSLANELGVLLLGDLPFYVAHDSADVWSKKSLFSIFPRGGLNVQSGVPPDYFSENGQLWGTPVYSWSQHRFTRFQWWRSRFHYQWRHADLLRLDHFRALSSYWAVSGKDKNAIDGSWEPSPGSELLNLLKNDFQGRLPLIAEDLGIITPEVEHLRDEFLLPGMKILQFAFNGDLENPYLPENINGENWVVYTGTHDNPTTLGWWMELDPNIKNEISNKFEAHSGGMPWQLIDVALSTKAKLVIAPIQDLLALDNNARFNTPGTIGNNWKWRMGSSKASLEDALKIYGNRGSFWGRSLESAVQLLETSSNK